MDIESMSVTIAKLEAKAGDTLVITVAQVLTSEQMRAVQEHAHRAMPQGVKAMILQGGLAVSNVISATEG